MTYPTIENQPVKTFKVLFVNQDSSEKLKFVQLDHPRLNERCDYLYDEQNNQLYELKRFNGEHDNPHSKKHRAVYDHRGFMIRSLIFAEKESIDGYVVENSEILVATKFNVIYLLLKYFIMTELRGMNINELDESNQSGRFLNFDDLIEQLQENSVFQGLPEEFFGSLEPSLSEICKVIREGDENYYRVSPAAIFQFLNRKVEALQKNLLETENTVKQFLSSKLSKPIDQGSTKEEEVPLEILDLATKRAAVQLISTYLPQSLGNCLLGQFEKDWETLSNHQLLVEKAFQERQIAEENLAKLNESIGNSSSYFGKRKNQKTLAAPKPKVKKVAVGKGALDGFFRAKAK
ncbi:Ribonuclease H2 subunit [Komagataella phaffii CBS 7435]|uniref:Ribonuclease H2 subunit B n=2 Tax=Komagataella phaffii TaxID=460519 RepID=C4QW57_KOMPG|nr:uncharacterized protein PAS_chr1-1_0474 [Komagataella phaffii GS115]AOA61078.1 GQ67_02691T0 [Komagataella phaffii]CAH2446146.1 Ribonuclease H2 subunit [Komagataella phaffii CBS 7435]AOA66628.1 GQ68_02557T0 [Komagataella phaffii GS115]CAY67480.1 hypothetical protein PAS_chr1-1_0474 [Komagataella phaffii GS115]CCA36576.1 Ribonuclease H2 subunit [Komagataella phaffii CBS 7435]